LNNSKIHGQEIRLMPKTEKKAVFDEKANVLVKNLDKEVT